MSQIDDLKKKKDGAVLLDFSSAFNLIDHEILLKKTFGIMVSVQSCLQDEKSLAAKRSV